MAQPRVLILRAPGTNCDLETAAAFARAGGRPEPVHVNRLLEQPDLLADYQILCLPGGFSYGDDIAAGRILGTQIQQRLFDVCHQFKAAGKLILGICNGFQILMKSGVLLDSPGGEQGGPPATLTWNRSGRFEARWVYLDCRGSRAVVFQGIEAMYLPIAHAEGKFVTRDAASPRGTGGATGKWPCAMRWRRRIEPALGPRRPTRRCPIRPIPTAPWPISRAFATQRAACAD